ncbi:MAG: hypothetical protein RR891_09560 [Clostridium sp.]|uniref:hypothetical protein n=1 Tax=Clostridium sp. TaxID=1506 RepID=UPI002FCB8B01
MSKNNKIISNNLQNSTGNNLSGINVKALGNYTKNAVKNFEENIVSETDYLEKVDKELE